jgi:predicted RNA methylase
MNKKDFYFRYVPPEKRARLVLDHEASYSVTDQVTADKITRDILQFVPESASITDGTACVGGNTFSFAKAFHHVYAVEIDPTRHSYLHHNMMVLGLSNVVCICGDAVQECCKRHQDLVFLDPPWGGPNYKNHESIQLQLSNRDLADVCADISIYCSYIALKVPVNFDVSVFDARVSGVLERVHYNTRLRKMHLIIYHSVCHAIARELEHLLSDSV